MADLNIDYDGLKKRGFLRQKQDGFFVLRIRMSLGVYTLGQLQKLTEVSGKFGRGIVHATTRQGLEIPFIKFEDIAKAEEELRAAGIETGASGARLRAITVCPGNNWCKSGLVDTFSLYGRIEKELGLVCGMDLPHKFKIAISGCPNGCTRPQAAEIGIHGVIDPETKQPGYVAYLGGCAGRAPRSGFRLERVFSDDEVLSLVGRVVAFFKKNAKPRQRLSQMIEEMGIENFLEEIKA
ncbi:MAG: hypothetical protein Q8O22_04190 [Candidatus Omnitrophota bacterium]|nr:hypothetical protein [Candidatus Omnitrophota bacterium]